MPKGYTLIRYGIFQWGWKCDDPETGCPHHSLFTKLTADGAQRYAWDHLRELSLLSNTTMSGIAGDATPTQK
jgi:hypothetical protein